MLQHTVQGNNVGIGTTLAVTSNHNAITSEFAGVFLFNKSGNFFGLVLEATVNISQVLFLSINVEYQCFLSNTMCKRQTTILYLNFALFFQSDHVNSVPRTSKKKLEKSKYYWQRKKSCWACQHRYWRPWYLRRSVPHG